MNCYELLEITSNASAEVIKAAYKAQVMKYHPDNAVTGNAERMAAINTAYKVLSNPTLRAEYDRRLAAKEASNMSKNDNVSNNQYKQDETSNTQQQEIIKNDKEKKLPVYLSLPVIFVLLYLFWPIAIVLFIIRISKLKKDSNIIDRDKKLRSSKRAGYGILVFCIFVIIIAVTTDDTESSNVVAENTSTSLSENLVGQGENIESGRQDVTDTELEMNDVANAMVLSEKKQEVAGGNSDSSLESYMENELLEEDILAGESEEIKKYVNGLYTEYFPTFILFEYEENLLFRKNVQLNIYIDGEKIAKVEQGDTPCYGVILTQGGHDLKVSSSIINSETEYFKVGESMYLGAVPNMFIVDVAFKNGKPEINGISGIDSSMYLSQDEAAIDYMMGYQYMVGNYQPVGDFEKIVGLYGELHPLDNNEEVFEYQEDSEVKSQVVGTWYIEGYDEYNNWENSYYINFYEYGTVTITGGDIMT